MDHPGPSWTTLDDPGPRWMILDHTGSSSMHLRSLSAFWIILGHARLPDPCMQPLRSERSPGPRQHLQTMKSLTFACTRATLVQPNLSQADFLGRPVPIHGSRTSYSKLTQSASPNEFITPEISVKNRRFSPCSVLGFWHTVFPG